MKTQATTKEHFEKYQKIVGERNFKIPASKETIIKQLNDGDKHLNGIPLKEWDMYTYFNLFTERLSLGERVCALKHYAVFKVAGYKPEFK